MSSFLSALNDLFLKMSWLETLVNRFLTNLLGMSSDHFLYPALSFFIYDVIKIFILLGAIVYLASFLQASITPEKTKQILSRFKGIKGNIFGALLGTVTPFCSCSSIPIFIGFTKAKLPLGVTFSFLISSPLVDIASILMLVNFFGVKIALYYVIFGLLLAVIGGTLIGIFYTDEDVESFVFDAALTLDEYESSFTIKKRHTYALQQVIEIYKKVWLFVLIGIFIGAMIHGYIPAELILLILGGNNVMSVLLAVLAGAPIYADIFGTLPIAKALVSKGVGVGTVLAFMMSVTTLSVPSVLLLKQVIKKRLLIGFVTYVLIGIVLTGITFNIIF
jgi:uncharacterized membrane protein YraQ (UPF0718 family)